MKSNNRDELDDVIDGALRAYSSADPMLGFAIPALAAVLIASVALRKGWDSQPRATNATPGPGISEPSPLASAPQPSPAPATRVVAPTPGIGTGQKPIAPARSLPKEEFFSARMPLTDEERALVAWVSHAPAEAAQAFADLEKGSAEPIQIPPIQIPPLQNDGKPDTPDSAEPPSCLTTAKVACLARTRARSG